MLKLLDEIVEANPQTMKVCAALILSCPALLGCQCRCPVLNPTAMCRLQMEKTSIADEKSDPRYATSLKVSIGWALLGRHCHTASQSPTEGLHEGPALMQVVTVEPGGLTKDHSRKYRLLLVRAASPLSPWHLGLGTRGVLHGLKGIPEGH